MTDKPEVKQVFITIRLPKGNDPGQVAYGFYTVVDALLTMTDQKGNAVQDDNGKSYSHKLIDGDDAYVIAARLTKKLRDALRGKRDAPTGFSGPLDYGSSGNAPY